MYLVSILIKTIQIFDMSKPTTPIGQQIATPQSPQATQQVQQDIYIGGGKYILGKRLGGGSFG